MCFNIKKNLLIAGAEGLIGSACLKVGKNSNLYNFFYPSKKELNYLNYKEFLNFCLNNKIDILIFAVGKVGGLFDNKENQIDYLLYNLELTNTLLKIARSAELEKIVTFSSSCMYPLNAEQPFKEKDLIFSQIEKTSYGYALAKFILTMSNSVFNKDINRKSKFINLIPNSVYGPHDNFDLKTGHVLACLIRRFFEAKSNNNKEIKLFGSGKPLREFIFSKDVADAVFYLLEKKDLDLNLPINLGTGYEISISGLANKIADIVNYNGKIKFDKKYQDGAPRKLLDSSIINNLGWKSSTILDKGLRETYEWFKNNLKK